MPHLIVINQDRTSAFSWALHSRPSTSLQFLLNHFSTLANPPPPFEQLPDDAWIYGTKGVYIVSNQDGSVLFTRKIDAVRYANNISSVSWEIAHDLV